MTESNNSCLSKYLAHAGVASRRKAVALIKEGQVTVNHAVVRDPAHKVAANETVRLNKQVIKPVHHYYLLLNKPIGYITTTSDEYGRPTIFHLLAGAPRTRLYPVGRLDRDSSGVLLITNDGALSHQLSHPRHQVDKIYRVELSRALASHDREALLRGIRLFDGPIRAKKISSIRRGVEHVISLTLSSGKNRIVRRMFEHLGYEVKSLDRIEYAGLTKRTLGVGKWRHLSAQEIAHLARK